MKRFRLARSLFPCSVLLAACTVHLHVHEAPAPAAEVRVAPEGPPPPSHASGIIAGITIDESGHPTLAHVGIVTSSGSRSTGTSASGRFRFVDVSEQPYVLTATTKDGRIATIPRVDVGSVDLRVLVVDQGCKLVVAMTGRPTARLAVFQDEVRVHDFTVRDGKIAQLVVPAGLVSIELYGTDLSEKRRMELAPGGTAELAFALDH